MSSHAQPAPTFEVSTAISPSVYFNKPAFERNGMEYVRFGSTGSVVSRVCLGLMSYSNLEKPWYDWMLDESRSLPFIKQALDAGINFFDTAEVYSNGKSEEFFGRALQQLLPASQFAREDLFIATKILPARSLAGDGFHYGIQKGLSRNAIFAAVEGSLKRLQTSYIDLYILHRYDPNTSPEETVGALHDLITAGRIRYVGASAMFLWQFHRLVTAGEKIGLRFVSMQNHYNALYREEEREMIPFCVDHGITLTPYSPLASGLLTRKPGADMSAREKSDPVQRNKYYKIGDDEVIGAVREVAEKRGVPPAQVALAWVLGKQGVSAPIIGATKPHHIEDAIKALKLKLTEEEITAIESQYLPHAVSGFS
ncbi:hypothetical protein HDU89_007830 [Geranomyces variabilis]|nr:hypothetical protein HDU89_007830 [Geranomyces variabilis]